MTEAEAAQHIVEEAREVLQRDLGVEIVKWGEKPIDQGKKDYLR